MKVWISWICGGILVASIGMTLMSNVQLAQAIKPFRERASAAQSMPVHFSHVAPRLDAALLEAVHRLARENLLEAQSLSLQANDSQLSASLTGSYLCFLEFLDTLSEYSINLCSLSMQTIAGEPENIRAEMVVERE